MIEINFLPDIYSFFYFFRFFQKKNHGRPKNYAKVPRLTQPNFTKQISLFSIFHTSQTYNLVWKIAKNQSHLVKFGCGNPGILL